MKVTKILTVKFPHLQYMHICQMYCMLSLPHTIQHIKVKLSVLHCLKIPPESCIKALRKHCWKIQHRSQANKALCITLWPKRYYTETHQLFSGWNSVRFDQEFIIYIKERVSSSRYTLYKNPASSSYKYSFDHIFTFRVILMMIKNCW